MRDLCALGNVLYLSRVNVGILVVILYSSISRCHHWENQVKENGDGSMLFLMTSCEYTRIPKQKVQLKNA